MVKSMRLLMIPVLLLSMAAAGNAAPAPTGKTVYDIVSPIGRITAKPKPLAASMNTLNGKTIGLWWELPGKFAGDVTFPKLAELIKKQYPQAKVIPYTDMPNGDTKTVIAGLKKLGVDVLISGNGG
jgi:hypothetical protein